MTQLLAILNITPDSFSDGGKATHRDAALQCVRQLIADGADGIDIGAESTRPGATPISPEEEWGRLAPVLGEAVAVCHDAGVIVSLDTRHAATAMRALALGVDWINDVGGFQDEAMIAAVANSECMLAMMHSLSVPADASIVLVADADPVAAVADFFESQLARLEAQGIARRRVLCDPGVGFSKTAVQSLALTLRMAELAVRFPLLVGHSRKSFMKLFSDAPADQRDDLTLAFSAMLAQAGVSWLRVHEVARHRRLLKDIQP